MRKIDLVLTELRGLRADTHEGLRAVNGRIDGVNVRLDTGLDRINARFEEMNARIDGVNARLDTGLDGLNARLDIVIDALADLRSDFDRHTHEA